MNLQADLKFIIMSIDPPKKINWNEYSDDNSSISESQPSILANNPEITKLNRIDPNFKYVWLKIGASNLDEASKSSIEALRYKEKNYAVYKSKETQGYQIKVDRNYAMKLFIDGIQKIKSTDIKVHEKNFKQKNLRNRKSTRKNNFNNPKQFLSEKKKINNVRSQKKIQYVDKETGEVANNKNNMIKRQIQQRERKYSKKQAETVGNQLALFRTKPFEERIKQKVEDKQHMLESVKSNPEKNRIRELKSAPKQTWLSKKNSNPSTKEEELPEEQLPEKIEKQKKKWDLKEEVKNENKAGKSKKKYIEKKEKQVEQEQNFYEYYSDKRKYHLRNKY